MLFSNKKEINYESYYKSTFIKMLTNKNSYTNKNIFIKKPKIKIFFWFKRIKEESLDIIKFFNNVILLWLITNQVIIISKLSSRLLKGTRFFRYNAYIIINNFFKYINFLNETYFPIIQKNSIKILYKREKKILYSLSDFDSFTNLRLSSNLYLNSVHNILYMLIESIRYMDIRIYFNCLKI